ncbi:Glutaredoxin domain-containing protein, partial [Psidium guajava]
DIQYLCTEEADPQTGSGSDSPRSPTIFHRARISSWAHRNAASSSPPTDHRHSSPSSLQSKLLPSSSDQEKPAVVVYFTSLRVVRKTFDDCRAVRSILRGLRVPVDERDLSMDSRFVAELQGILGRKRLSLPCVLVRGRLVGGAEEVRKLHESGELRALVAGGASPAAEPGACGACGGLRYAVCERCSGSRKIYSDKHGFKSCKACN